jgi:hypothetical protein
VSVDRDAIYQALFERLKDKFGAPTQTGWVTNVAKTMGRRHMMPPNLVSALQPAVFVVQGPEEKDPRPRGTGGKVTLHGFIIAYCYDNASNPDGSTQLNILMKATEEALEPDPEQPGEKVLTLGGLVQHCWIEGPSDVDPGIFGQQAVAIIPVHMLVP